MSKKILITYVNYNKKKNRLIKNFFTNIKGFDKIIIWNPELLNIWDKNLKWTVKNYYNEYKKYASSTVKINKSWAENGFLIWKPYIIHLTLKKFSEEGDTIFYHDSDFIKYPRYKKNLSNVYLNFIKSYNIKSVNIFQDSEKPLHTDCKPYLLEKYFKNFFDNGLYLNGFWAGAIILKNNNFSIRFINQWKKITTLKNCAPHPFNLKNSKLAEDFNVAHSNEQATLAVNYYINYRFSKNINFFYVPMRLIININFSSIKYLKNFLKLKLINNNFLRFTKFYLNIFLKKIENLI